jgi:hypothetical protein
VPFVMTTRPTQKRGQIVSRCRLTLFSATGGARDQCRISNTRVGLRQAIKGDGKTRLFSRDSGVTGQEPKAESPEPKADCHIEVDFYLSLGPEGGHGLHWPLTHNREPRTLNPERTEHQEPGTENLVYG